MEMIIFTGIQASGKSTFYKERFFRTHMRISMDMLNTRNKEQKFLDLSFSLHQRVVVDNTNPAGIDRRRYIEQAKNNKYKVIGFYFQSKIEDAIKRNSNRVGKECIPEIGIRSTSRKLELPSFDEGFDELYYVEIDKQKFKVKNWTNEI